MSIEAQYIYVDERGRPRLRKTRTRDKRFYMDAARYRHDRLYWKGDPGCIEKYQPEWAPRALYHLPVLLDALKLGAPVFLVEGERDADALLALKRLPATTNWQGAGKFTHEQAEWFTRGKGSAVNIVRDNDPAGAYAAWTRYSALRLVGVPRKHIRLWVPGQHKDIAEALESRRWPALVREIPSAVEALAAQEDSARAARGYLSPPTDKEAER